MALETCLLGCVQSFLLEFPANHDLSQKAAIIIKMVIINIYRNLGLGQLKMAGEFSQFYISHCQDLRQSPKTPIATT